MPGPPPAGRIRSFPGRPGAACGSCSATRGPTPPGPRASYRSRGRRRHGPRAGVRSNNERTRSSGGDRGIVTGVSTMMASPRSNTCRAAPRIGRMCATRAGRPSASPHRDGCGGRRVRPGEGGQRRPKQRVGGRVPKREPAAAGPDQGGRELPHERVLRDDGAIGRDGECRQADRGERGAGCRGTFEAEAGRHQGAAGQMRPKMVQLGDAPRIDRAAVVVAFEAHDDLVPGR